MHDAKLPTSRWRRVGRLASLGASIGAKRIASLSNAEQGTRAVAEAAAEALGQMRGLAMKVGQMASYVDGMIPTEHGELFEKALAPLRAAAPTMTPEAAARVVREELGKPPQEVFSEWEREPLASASIGQVHRARTSSGEQVAVKVQVEGIDKAVRADLGNAGMVTKLVPFAGRIGVHEQLAELRARFSEELDYEHEARRQQQFECAFASDPKITIPRVLPELSTRRVLTTVFSPGLPFERAVEAAPEARRQWAETLWRFVFESILVHGLFNADPHPGNYLFEPDGVVAFLDFGCTRELTSETLERVRRVHRLAAAREHQVMRAALFDLIELPSDGIIGELASEYMDACFAPILNPGSFRITKEYAGSLVSGLQAKKLRILREAPTKIKAPPAELLFFNRLQIGFYSVLARLDVPVDYHALHREMLG